MVNRNSLLKNFLKYVKINTQVARGVETIPSSSGQFELAKIVVDDLKNAGLTDVVIKENTYVFATIPENIPVSQKGKKIPTVGFLAHFDTAEEAPGENVKPQIIENYQGQKITYPANSEFYLDTKEAPELSRCIGHTIITTDGSTLLGGDCKAGIAVIVEMADYLVKHKEIPHGKIRICLIPDEEKGVGAEVLNLKEFGVDVAYTVDGGGLGEIDVESFNGFTGTISIKGFSAFPGYGKGIYLNAAKVLSEFVAKMSDSMWPENCEKRDPIWWIDDVKASTSSAEASIFLRNFDIEGIEGQKKTLEKIRTELIEKYPKAKITIDIPERYRNYKQHLDKDPRVVKYAEEAMKKIGITPVHKYVRGGNDSCHLCAQGLISTNLFIGMQRMHSLQEWISLDVIEKATETVISLAGVWYEKSV